LSVPKVPLDDMIGEIGRLIIVVMKHLLILLSNQKYHIRFLIISAKYLKVFILIKWEIRELGVPTKKE